MDLTMNASVSCRGLSVARRAVVFAQGASSRMARKLSSWGKLKSFRLSGTVLGSRGAVGQSRAKAAVAVIPQGTSNSNNARPGLPAARRPGVLWYRSDLRLDDNEALSRATAECSSLLPVYCFDPRDYSRSPQGYNRTGPYRATFLVQAVADLRQRLRAAGSDLIVRIGRPEEVIPELVRRVGAAAVYCHAEVTFEDKQVEIRVSEAVSGVGAQLQSLWTNTLHRLEDLPFNLAAMPQNFDSFRAKLAGVTARAALATPEQLKGLPAGAAATIDAGEVPTLKQLGLESLPSGGSEGPEATGGETEAKRQLQQFFAAAKARGKGAGAAVVSGAATGSSFSSRVAPWLATGCLSPRRMLVEAQNALSGGAEAEREGAGGGCRGLQWVEYELLWRDFFRLLTKKHADVVLPKVKEAMRAAPAATPALAMA